MTMLLKNLPESLQSEWDSFKERLSRLEEEVQANKKTDTGTEEVEEKESNEEEVSVTKYEFNSLCKKSFLTNEEFDKIFAYAKKNNSTWLNLSVMSITDEQAKQL